MKYAHVYVLFLMSVFFTSCGQNQTNSPIENIRVETEDTVTFYGPNTMVRNVKKGSNGTILIASNKGVFRYDAPLPDGQEKSLPTGQAGFTNITSKIKSPGFWFPDVLEDRKGNLWLTAWGFSNKPSKPGVYRYNEKSFPAGQTGLPTGQAGFHFTTKEGLASDTVNSIYEDKAGNIWFGADGGLSRYDGKSFRNFTTKDGVPNNRIGSILEDKTGKLWFVSGGELCFYDGKTFTVPSFFRNKDGKGFNVWSIIEDKKGNILFGAFLVKEKKRISPHGVISYGGIGLWRYDGSTITQVSQTGARAVLEDKKGNIWTVGNLEINGKDWALSRFDEKFLYNKKPPVTEIMFGGQVPWVFANTGMLEADDGNIWFGANGDLYRYDGKTITDFNSKEVQK